jgi:hypothetical protein
MVLLSLGVWRSRQGRVLPALGLLAGGWAPTDGGRRPILWASSARDETSKRWDLWAAAIGNGSPLRFAS